MRVSTQTQSHKYDRVIKELHAFRVAGAFPGLYREIFAVHRIQPVEEGRRQANRDKKIQKTHGIYYIALRAFSLNRRPGGCPVPNLTADKT